MTGPLPTPLGGPPPDEIPLSRSPLVRVVAQVRFSSVLKIDSKDGMVPFQEAVRAEYPLLTQAAGQQFQMDFSSGAPHLRPVSSNIWRFADAGVGWRLSLTTEAVTLETRCYAGRPEFLTRWLDALAHVEQIFGPVLALRRGMRYLNRIQGESLAELSNWVRPNLVGVAEPELRQYVTQAMSEANITIDEGALLLRWGLMPPNSTFDPALLEPVPDPSWILDIDVSSADQRPFSSAALSDEFGSLAERAYSIFRYAIKEAGLARFGADT